MASTIYYAILSEKQDQEIEPSHRSTLLLNQKLLTRFPKGALTRKLKTLESAWIGSLNNIPSRNKIPFK
jgi:hypothetical protein